MNAPAQTGRLLPLVMKLKACPSRDQSLSPEELIKTWNSLKQTDPANGDEITPAVMAGLVLFDGKQFAQLLNKAERSQLAVLAAVALERYLQKINPPNKLGKTLAASWKEST